MPVERTKSASANKASTIRGVEAVNADYEEHRRAARALAEDLFASDRVLPELLEKAMA